MKFDLENDWLPVGSVVSIRLNSKKFMIIGYAPTSNNGKNIHDYYALVYPYGFVSHEDAIFFNRDVIKKIYHIGYVDNDYKDFKKIIDNSINLFNTNH